MKFTNLVGPLTLFEPEDGAGRGRLCLNVIADTCMSYV